MQNINFILRFIIICCFELLWTHLSTLTWNDRINLLLLLISYHMQKTNFITQLILETWLTHHLLSLWAWPSIPDNTQLKQLTHICCFREPLVTSKNLTSYLSLFVKYCSLKNPAFWLLHRLFRAKLRPKFFPKELFLQRCFRKGFVFAKTTSIFVLGQKNSLNG